MMKQFHHKKILIAPFSPMTKAFKDFLIHTHQISFVGFIDKNAQGENIYQYSDVESLDFDAILVLSPNHSKNIIRLLKKNRCKKSSCFEITINSNEYGLAKKTNITEFITPFFYKLFFNVIKFYFYLIPIERKRILFISKDFIGSNNKFLFLYCLGNNIDTMMLSDNESQITELKNSDLPTVGFNSLAAIYNLAIAKVIVFDQGNYTYLPELSHKQKTIQLWHGVGLKKMSKLDNITYDYFVSTSDWTNETNFKHIFSSKHYVNCGYPRNDILLKEGDIDTDNKKDKLNLLFSDKEIYHFVKEKQKTSTILLYMPTHREKSGELPLDFKKLNQQLVDLNAYLIVKLHPFVLQFYKELDAGHYSQIKVHDPQGDIYPLLAYCDVLISDYSSIVYDYLLLDRPIIFFNYDYEEYVSNYGEFLFDYDEYSPGIKVKDQQQLMEAIKVIHNESKAVVLQRKAIRNLFYDKFDNHSSSRIMELVRTC
ncbi:MAG: hypothetical protein DRJ07_13010 [Bacteroidetes bacterium]|nr:MAG: hypothetical protein DRJ07_13010 [Bacteroidota bacterium]